MTEAANPPAIPTATVLRAYLRVHVHTALRLVWLTPSTLTVRSGARGVRFSVLAEFDDGSYGDITNWSPRTFDPAKVLEVRETATRLPVASWSSNTPAHLDVNANSGALVCKTQAANVTITLRTRSPAGLAIANAVGALPWSTPVGAPP